MFERAKRPILCPVSASQPIVIYRSVNREGQTFALKPASRQFLRQQFGESVHSSPRVFIAHETKADFDEWHDNFAEQVIQLLTGVSSERLKGLGGVVFRDPVTESDISAA